MSYPPLVSYKTVEEYRFHFETVYCSKQIFTFDGIAVRFRKRDFDHCFYESIIIKDDTFSSKRAERIDWIKATLQDANSERYQGWNKKKKRYEKYRRVAIVMRDYVVVIAIKGKKSADFVTAFIADTPGYKGKPSTIDKIRMGPKWT